MNRQEKIESRRNKRLQLKNKKSQEDALEEELVEELDEDTLPEELETQSKKDYDDSYVSGMATPSMVLPPASWEELEDRKRVKEQEHEIRELTWDVQDLVYAIVSNPAMTPDEKAERIKSVGDGFGARVKDVMNSDPLMKDLDLEVIESILAHDKRANGAVSQALDVVKAKLTAKRENALSDDQFALVRTDGEEKVRKYPIHDKSHVRSALSRAAQMIAQGGDAAKDAKAALPKIHAAAKRFGIAVSTKEHNGIMVEKDSSGSYRWVGFVSNSFIDWDTDIFCEAAHKEYVDWFWENKDVSPVFVSWHTPGTARKSQVDFAGYENGFLMMSGPLADGEAHALLKAQEKYDLGMSHGAFIFARDETDPRIVTKYRMYECSDLPVENAANPFTSLDFVTKEVGMDKLAYLADILGSEERAKAFMERTGLKQKELEAAGIEHKDVADPAAEPAQVAQPPAPESTDKALEDRLAELDIPGLNAWVEKANVALGKVEVLEAMLKELSKSREDAVAEMIAPPALKSMAWSAKRASASDDNVIKDGDDLAKARPAIPENAWLSQATGTAPIAS